MNAHVSRPLGRNLSLLSILLLVMGMMSAAQNNSMETQPNPASADANSQAAASDENSAEQSVNSESINSESMVPPPAASGAGYSLAFTSEMERSNYLRGGLSATAAYQDNVISDIGNVGSDVSYTIGPFIALDLTRPRYRLNFTYSPGFTFYQRHSALDQTSQALALSFSERLSPHVTFTAQDSFVRTSAFLGPLSFNGTDSLPNPIQSPNLTVVAPVADTLIDATNVGIAYQFGRNDMVGATGNYSLLNYLNRNQVSGLFDSSGEGAGAYYNHKFANRNYLGVNYQFQRYVTDETLVQFSTDQLETRTDSLFATYTLYIKPTLSVTAFGGPQYSDTFGGTLVPLKMWSPAAGGSLSWQGEDTSFAASFSRRITDGGGLQGAVRANIADASFRAQITKTLTGSVSADYATNAVLDAAELGGFNGALNGHSVSEAASLGRTFGEHWNASISYLHLHQSYADVSTFSIAPNQNRASASVSYSFERPLGR